MTDGIKGWNDLQRLYKKEKTWNPPETLEEYLNFVRLVITTSKYTDSYQYMDQEDLAAVIRMKIGRFTNFPDIEECVDAASYSYLMYDKLRSKMADLTNKEEPT